MSNVKIISFSGLEVIPSTLNEHAGFKKLKNGSKKATDTLFLIFQKR